MMYGKGMSEMFAMGCDVGECAQAYSSETRLSVMWDRNRLTELSFSLDTMSTSHRSKVVDCQRGRVV